MIHLYSWPAPNGHKVQILVEELRIPYRLIPINITKGEQREPGYLAINPNAKIPAIIDDEPLDGGEPITVFESGAVMLYLAEKMERFLPVEPRQRIEMLQWLFWQVGGLGPMMDRRQCGGIRECTGLVWPRACSTRRRPGARSAARALGGCVDLGRGQAQPFQGGGWRMSAQDDSLVDAFIDLRSPYSYLSLGPARQLAERTGVRFEWWPYITDFRSAYGGEVEERTGRDVAKVRYLYMDCRRLAKKQGT
jgi:hypothetical protein